MISMTKTGSTKNKILALISSGNKTLSEISEALGLAPSTVSQHLQELKDMGAIEEVDTDHVRKWKYYKLNPNFNYDKSPIGEGIIVKKLQSRIFYYAIGLGILAALAYFVLFSNTSSSIISQPQNGGTFVPIRLTDPPNVPNGTQSLVINYSSVAVHVESNSSSGWVESNTRGTIDLMTLLNVSQVIAGINVTANSIINAVRFNITSAEITINNTVYNVTVPSSMVIAQVTSPGKVNATTGVLVDLSPTVVALYTNNSTVFVMVPSIKAVVVPGTSSNSSVNFKAASTIGYRARLNQNDIIHLQSARENISITNASLIETNDSLSMQVTVKNNGNQSVVLGDILVVGNQTPVFTYNGTCNTPSGTGPVPLWCRISGPIWANVIGGHRIRHASQHATFQIPYVSGNTTASSSLNATNQGSGFSGNSNFGNGPQGMHGSIYVSGFGGSRFRVQVEGGAPFNYTQNQTPVFTNGNQSQMWPLNIKVKFPQNANSPFFGNIMINGTVLAHFMVPRPRGNFGAGISMPPFQGIENYRGLEFMIQSNGNLSIENGIYAAPLVAGSMAGYTLQPGQSETFTFTGQISLPGDFQISLVPGAHYRIGVFGQYGAHTVANVTAT